ncbi:dihydroorotase [Capnocytophaga sp. oral taxon 338 str. F0234]|nr:dihydroorotase [Capnocytophaga sp. oral taxon 338 str. F0234]
MLLRFFHKMKTLLKSVTIIDRDSSFHKKTQDILIENGAIIQIAHEIAPSEDCDVISNCYISQGWADSSVSFGEPGYEERETLAHGVQVASESGFTQIILNPTTHPITETRSQINYLKTATEGAITQVFPIGALTTESKGEYLAELYNMQKAGAVAFGDYKRCIPQANLLKIALQYTQTFGGIVISFPCDSSIMGKGVVNEHINSTRLGLKGIPALAEEIIVARDLSILEYAGGKLHIPTISTAQSVALIAQAKEKGLDVTCSVALHNLHFTDNTLDNFNTNYKVLPPLRDKAQVEALHKGVENGTIDMVTTDHYPLDIECKAKEFDLADFGTIGLEAAFGILIQHFSLEKVIEMLTKAKKRFFLPSSPIKVGAKADITLFNIDGETTFSTEMIRSSSKNCAFIGEKCKGNVLGVITERGKWFKGEQ